MTSPQSVGRSPGTIRVGIGGWTYPPWRGVFYPVGLPQACEFDHAVASMTTIEVNATFYGRQKPASWVKWAAGAPAGFKFAVKGSRYVVTRKHLADASEGITQFLEQGLAALGDKLGPILWQFAGTRQFDAIDVAAFVKLLPHALGDHRLRHVLEPRHASFATTEFETIARDAGVAVAFADDDVYPCIDFDTADFRYARLQRAIDLCPTGYDSATIARWADAAQRWARTGDAYVYFISGAKVRNPAAATTLIARLGRSLS